MKKMMMEKNKMMKMVRKMKKMMVKKMMMMKMMKKMINKNEMVKNKMMMMVKKKHRCDLQPAAARGCSARSGAVPARPPPAPPPSLRGGGAWAGQGGAGRRLGAL